MAPAHAKIHETRYGWAILWHRPDAEQGSTSGSYFPTSEYAAALARRCGAGAVVVVES